MQSPDPLLAQVIVSAVNLADENKKTPGVPYKIQTPETTYVHVSSEQHMNELKASSKDQLSLHAWANDVSEPIS